MRPELCRRQCSGGGGSGAAEGAREPSRRRRVAPAACCCCCCCCCCWGDTNASASVSTCKGVEEARKWSMSEFELSSLDLTTHLQSQRVPGGLRGGARVPESREGLAEAAEDRGDVVREDRLHARARGKVSGGSGSSRMSPLLALSFPTCRYCWRSSGIAARSGSQQPSSATRRRMSCQSPPMAPAGGRREAHEWRGDSAGLCSKRPCRSLLPPLTWRNTQRGRSEAN
jgi:hypothetical protein